MQNQAEAAGDVLARLRATHHGGATRNRAWRKAQIKALMTMIKAEEPAILRALTADLRKSRDEAMMTELGPIAHEARHALRHLRRWMAPRRVTAPLIAQPATARVIPQPLGVVLIIGAWNFPFHETLTPMIGALAAGNCVVIKPSELAPHCAALLAEIVPRYLDRDAVAVVEGGPSETQDLLSHRFDHILYTGSGRVGRLIMARAAEHLTPVTLELGGKSPVIVDPTADIATTARRIAWAKMTCAGQVCINADTIYVHEDCHDALIAALRAAFGAMLGADAQAARDYARIINPRHFDRLVGLMALGRLAHGGRHDRDDLFIEPTILTDLPPDAPVMQEEIFGPILPIVRWSDADALIAQMQAGDAPLALYLFGRDRAFQDRVVEAVPAGNVAINDLFLFMALPELPFGGVGASGMGAYKGQAGFATFSHFKPVLRKSIWPDPSLRYAPYGGWKSRLLRALWG